MFEITFRTELTNINTNQSLIDKLWREIKTSYSKPHRHYHTLSHLDKLINELLPVKDKINDWQTIVLSIAYHDIIYNPLKQDNEEKSGNFAYSRLTLLNLAIRQKDKCREQILATKAHNISADSDTNYFTDADLSILGSEYNSYRKYTDQIRNEYKFYPDFLYNPGRQRVLNHFLQMPTIFKTTYFAEKYEQQAKDNMINELKAIA